MFLKIFNISVRRTFFNTKNRVATLPGKLEFYKFLKKPGKTWNFKQKSVKNLEKSGISNNFYMFSSKISL